MEETVKTIGETVALCIESVMSHCSEGTTILVSHSWQLVPWREVSGKTESDRQLPRGFSGSGTNKELGTAVHRKFLSRYSMSGSSPAGSEKGNRFTEHTDLPWRHPSTSDRFPSDLPDHCRAVTVL